MISNKSCSGFIIECIELITCLKCAVLNGIHYFPSRSCSNYKPYKEHNNAEYIHVNYYYYYVLCMFYFSYIFILQYYSMSRWQVQNVPTFYIWNQYHHEKWNQVQICLVLVHSFLKYTLKCQKFEKAKRLLLSKTNTHLLFKLIKRAQSYRYRLYM